MGCWETNLFRRSHFEVNGFVHRIVDEYARIPRFFFTMDEPDIEKGHFAPWFAGAIGKRKYANAAISDLFHLHEMYHMAKLTYDPNADWDEWAAKLAINEIRASITSEVLVYFALPGLRDMAFTHEIWADRFLRSGTQLSEVDILCERWRASDFPRDDIERRIALFRDENRAWAELWRPNYRVAEAAMARLVEGSKTDRAAAAKAHARWLLEEAPRRAGTPYPFPEEAEAFAKIYWSTRERAAAGTLD
jgi:hypothetical protein